MRRALLTGLVLGVLLGGCAVTAQPPGGRASGSTAETAAPSLAQDAGPAAPGEPAAGPATPTTDRPAAGAVTVRTAAGVPAAPAAHPPARLVIPALDVDMPVEPTGVAADGQMAVPEDAARAGWYRHGPTVGAPSGTAVIAAHSGSFITARGPLRHLVDAAPGDRIDVHRADGAVLTYEVSTVDLVDKAVIELAQYFRRAGAHGLVLFTCDGEWLADRHSYSDNAVLTATLVGT